MTENNDILKNFLHESYNDYSPDIHADSWEKIESVYKVELIKIKYIKFSIYSSISLLFLLVFTISINLKQNVNESELVELADQNNKNTRKGNYGNALLNETETFKQSEILTPVELDKQTMQLIDENKDFSPQYASVSFTDDSKKEKLRKASSPDFSDNSTIVLDNNSFDSVSINPIFNIDQSNTELLSLKHNFYIKLNLSATYKLNESEIQEERLPEIHEDYVFIKSNSERLNMSFSAGINLLYNYNEKFSIQSGLFLSQYRTFGQYDFANDKIAVRDSATNHILGYLIGSDAVIVNQKINKSISYLEVPLILGLQQNFSEKISLTFKSGLSYSKLLQANGQEISYYNLETKNLNKRDYNSSNWGLILGIGCNYKINNEVILGVEPTYKQYISTQYSPESALHNRPAFIGLNCILLYKIPSDL